MLTVQSSTGVSSADNYDMKCQIGMWKEEKIAQFWMRKLNYGVCGHKVLINQLCQRKNNRRKISASKEHQVAAALGFETGVNHNWVTYKNLSKMKVRGTWERATLFIHDWSTMYED